MTHNKKRKIDVSNVRDLIDEYEREFRNFYSALDLDILLTRINESIDFYNEVIEKLNDLKEEVSTTYENQYEKENLESGNISLRDCDTSLHEDEDLMLDYLSRFPDDFGNLESELKDDKDFIGKLLEENPRALKWIPDVTDDEKLVDIAMNGDSYVIKYASERLQGRYKSGPKSAVG